jgi:RNA polymerase sigma-70 factor (ECF subfamily)
MIAFLQPSDMLNQRRMAGVQFDTNYLDALKHSNQEAENYLISYFSRPVQLKLQARLRSPELIQDARQETFLRVIAYFRSGKTLDNPASLPGFVHTVCHNVALELLRAHTRYDQLAENAPEPADFAPSPESQMVTAESKELVARVLDELVEKDRDLLRRVLLEEEDKDKVCRAFGVDRGYLRVLLHRARGRFKTALLDSEARKVAPSRDN